MSDETETEATETEDEAKAKTDATLLNPLSKPGDRAERPGFRSTSNTGSKAQRKKKKKKKR